jgi:peptidoglycan/xylan/chitin deacetylase (PgdA/CDA1 family)
MSFWVKTKWIVKVLFPKYVWDIPNSDKMVYLTFDDGPTPEITEWVLDQLNSYNAKATFFCIGNNIEKVQSAGHAIGNHTFNHLKGWSTPLAFYIDNVKKCGEYLADYLKDNGKQKLFRPPYGKIKRQQAKAILKLGYKIIMWDVISMDFEERISSEQCLANVLNNVTSGSIIVFHDSQKAKKHLQFVLPKTLAYLQEQQFVCEAIGNPDDTFLEN